jgi:hypothetical protein
MGSQGCRIGKPDSSEMGEIRIQIPSNCVGLRIGYQSKEILQKQEISVVNNSIRVSMITLPEQGKITIKAERCQNISSNIENLVLWARILYFMGEESFSL